MNFDNLTPRAKTVQAIRTETNTVVRFNKVCTGRCATDALYRHVFEAVRAALAATHLKERKCDFEQGQINASFRWFLIFPLKLEIVFYSAGTSTVVDIDKRDGQGWFKKARRVRAEKFLQRLCSKPVDVAQLSAAGQHPDSVRPPAHT